MPAETNNLASGPVPPRLERAIQIALATTPMNVGEPLPTVRQLAADLHLDASTVAKAYAELERAGIIESREGVWTLARLYCLACGAQFKEQAKYCKQCGAGLSPSTVAARRGAPPAIFNGLLWAISAVSVGGLAAVFGGVSALLYLGAPSQLVMLALTCGLLAVFTVVALLIRQLSRLSGAAQEKDGPAQLKRPVASEPASEQPTGALPDTAVSVTEPTTRPLH